MSNVYNLFEHENKRKEANDTERILNKSLADAYLNLIRESLREGVNAFTRLASENKENLTDDYNFGDDFGIRVNEILIEELEDVILALEYIQECVEEDKEDELMTKKLVRIYVTYGKGDGEELVDEYVFKDTKEGRTDLLDESFGGYSYALDSEDDFIDGKIDYFNVDLDGGDWDDPTGRAIVLYDKDEMIASINAERDSEIANVERLFDREDE